MATVILEHPVTASKSPGATSPSRTRQHPSLTHIGNEGDTHMDEPCDLLALQKIPHSTGFSGRPMGLQW
jgi:hypothetical protein